MNKLPPTALLLAALLGLSQCQHGPAPAPVPPTALSQLPPETQTGANTFGCLVNGQPYTPSGYNGTPNFAVLYDPGYQGGSLDVRTYKYPQSGVSKTQEVAFGGINVNHVGTYQIGLASEVGASFIDDYRPSPCNEYRSNRPGIYSKGTITITRLDQQAGIVSGTFAFTLAQPGCDTIKVTQGRFDYKF